MHLDLATAADREQEATWALKSSHTRTITSKERRVVTVAELSGSDNNPRARHSQGTQIKRERG